MFRPIGRRAVLAALALAPRALKAQRRAVVAPAPSEALLSLAGSCVMTGWYGRGLDGTLRALMRRDGIGGLFVRRNNFSSRADLTAMCSEVRAGFSTAPPPLIAADQEGGPVENLAPPLVSIPSMTALGHIDDIDLTRRAGQAIGSELRSVGVSMDLAPVLDVRTSPHNIVDIQRAFGRDPQLVARHGRAFIDGLASTGVLCCPKHFPGHGDTSVDSHAGLPRLMHGLERLDRVELVPFRECLAQSSAIMMAHVVYAGIDANNPASLSSGVIDGVLRRHLGYTGVVVTDDLQMAAVRARGGIEAAAVTAIRAGADLALVAHSQNIAVRVIHHMAALAGRDAAFFARLTEARARVRALRDRAAAVFAPGAPAAPAVDALSISREIRRRIAALPRARAASRP